MLRTDAVALYVDPLGSYPALVRDWYDAARDATTYRGRSPVVAHPPCGPWGGLSALHKTAFEIAFAPHAVAVVQRCGGVLEHPAGSSLFDALNLPQPGMRDLAHDAFTVEVQQCDFGHVARKRTWLYIVGLRAALPPMPPPREPTHWVSGGRRPRRPGSRRGSPMPPGIKACSAQQRRRTPMAFAEWLLETASRCGR